MTQGPNEGPTASRGRRRPDIAMAMEADNQLAGDDEPIVGDAISVDLLPGDVIAAKVVAQITVGDQDAWVTYGVQSQVQLDETEEEAAGRVMMVVGQRFTDMADEAATAIEKARDDWNGRRTTGRRS